MSGGSIQGRIAAPPRGQDPEAASYAPRLFRSDGFVALSLEARQIEGRIRGFDPWPGVWVRCRGRRLRLADGRAVEHRGTSGAPGTVLALGSSGLEVACGEGTILAVRAVQPEGRARLEARDAVNGRHVAVGDVLERIVSEPPGSDP